MCKGRGYGLVLAAVIGAVGSGCGGKTKSTDQSGARDDGPRDGGAVVTDGAPPRTDGAFFDRLQASRIDEVDLLFVVDNSHDMGPAQDALRASIPGLIERLLLPRCLAEDGRVVATGRETCPDGTRREPPSVQDLHVGVITSSLDNGSFACSRNFVSEGANDHGWLLGARPRAASVPTTGGVLQFHAAAGDSVSGLIEHTQALVAAAGASGCGFESSLESWYRFLVDPAPPEEIQIVPCAQNRATECATPVGIDETLLAQRARFLRPDSLVGIVLLTEENDCSIRAEGQLPLFWRSEPMPAASSVCADAPNDPCCYSCGVSPPQGCAPDPACAAAPTVEPGPVNLRCWAQRERFGLDFLYPVSRYVNALTQPALCAAKSDLSVQGCPGEVVPNPLFADASGQLVRPFDSVHLIGIVGVPYQELERQADDFGNAYPDGELHFKSASELAGDDTWKRILGDPEANRQPRNPLMLESVEPRAGSVAVTGERLVGPNGEYLENSINGHEYLPEDDLQYACIFPLPEVPTCDPSVEGCRCDPERSTLDPVCQNARGSYDPVQYFGKAYPSLRQLQLLQRLGEQATTASICPRNLTDTSAQDYAYLPAFDALTDRLQGTLAGRCLPRELQLEDGQTPCSIWELVPGGEGCDASRGRQAANAESASAVLAKLEEDKVCGTAPSPACDSFSVCLLQPADERCLAVDSGDAVGWCYVDPSQGAGDPALVEHCPPDERRLLRFVDPLDQTPRNQATVFISCPGAAVVQE